MAKQRITLASTLVAAALLLPACGTGTTTEAGGAGGSSPSGGGSTAASPSSASASPGRADGSDSAKPSKPRTSMPPARVRHRCHTSQLAASISMRDSAAGHRHAVIALKNTSQTACTIYGYGGMQLYGSDGDKVPTNLVRDHSHEPTTSTLAPGDTAYSKIRWTTVPQGDNACTTKAASARVTPPDETDSLTIPWKSGPVCGHGRIMQLPYVAKDSSIDHPA